MTTRRSIITLALLAAVAVQSNVALAEEKTADFLFVQNAQSMTYANGKVTLKGVSPVTVMFSDRPDRVAGNMKTSDFVPFWTTGKDSFAKDNPNATLSVLEKDKALADVVVTLSNPVLKGGNLSYDVNILEGKMPATGGPAVLFIDIIGMPMTPMSYAGAARRVYRR